MQNKIREVLEESGAIEKANGEKSIHYDEKYILLELHSIATHMQLIMGKHLRVERRMDTIIRDQHAEIERVMKNGTRDEDPLFVAKKNNIAHRLYCLPHVKSDLEPHLERRAELKKNLKRIRKEYPADIN